MPDEVVPQGAAPAEPAAPAAAPVAEPRNVREAIAARVAGGVPEIINTPDEPVVEEHATETDPLDEFAAPAEPAAPAAPAADDPWAQFGGEEEVRNAVAIQQALRTESGARLIAAQTLHALGYDPDAIKAALEVKGATPAEAAAATAQVVDDPLAGLADDDILTAADVKALVARATQSTAEAVRAELAQATKPLEDSITAQRQQQASNVTDSTLIELLGPPPGDPATAEHRAWLTNAQAVLAEAAVGFDANQWDPAYIRQSVIRGHAAWQANEDRKLAAYVAQKKAARDATPTHVGGAQQPGAETEQKEPRNVKEAIAMRKATGVV